MARRVLVEKLYPDATEPIGRNDLMWWIPSAHKNWLLKPYDATLEPIVEKVYAGEEIAEDAYRYVYEPSGNTQGDSGVPVVRSQWFRVDENQSGPLLIGTVKVADEGNSSVTGFSLSGEGAQNFRLDADGKLYAKAGVHFDYETRPYYQLTLTARNAQGSSRPVSLYILVNNLPDIPEDRGFSGGSVAEDAPEGTVAGQVLFDPGAAPIDRIELGGPDAGSFTVDRNGTIRVSAHSQLDYERSPAAHITLQAFNALGASRVVPVTLAVTDAVDVPIVGTLDVKLPENSPTGTLVGTVSIRCWIAISAVTEPRISPSTATGPSGSPRGRGWTMKAGPTTSSPCTPATPWGAPAPVGWRCACKTAPTFPSRPSGPITCTRRALRAASWGKSRWIATVAPPSAASSCAEAGRSISPSMRKGRSAPPGPCPATRSGPI